MPLFAPATKRMSLVTVDQIIAGASNFAIIIFAAHVLVPAEFGLFTLLFLSFAIALTVCRALICGTVLVHPADAEQRPGAILGSASTVAIGSGALFALAAVAFWLAGATVGPALAWLAFLAPLLLIQDVGRHLAIATGRPARAIILDVAWIGIEVVGFTLLVVTGSATLTTCIAVWAGAGAVTGLWVFAQYGLPRRHDWGPAWLRQRWGFSWRNFVTGLTEQSGILAALTVIVAVTTATVVAAVQAVTLLTRPAYTVILAIGQANVAEVARDEPDDRQIWTYVRRAVFITLVTAVANLAVMLMLPDPVGRAILGRTWPLAEPLLLAAGLQVVFLAARSGVRSALMGRRQIRLIMALDLSGTALIMPLLVVGASVGGALGVAWAGAGAQALLTVVWWLMFLRHLRRPPEQREAGDGSAAARVSPR